MIRLGHHIAVCILALPLLLMGVFGLHGAVDRFLDWLDQPNAEEI